VLKSTSSLAVSGLSRERALCCSAAHGACPCSPRMLLATALCAQRLPRVARRALTASCRHPETDVCRKTRARDACRAPVASLVRPYALPTRWTAQRPSAA